VSDEELKAAIREAYPVFQARVASGEIIVRGPLTYAKKGPSVGGVPEGVKA
jgi:hypothetical protein